MITAPLNNSSFSEAEGYQYKILFQMSHPDAGYNDPNTGAVENISVNYTASEDTTSDLTLSIVQNENCVGVT